MALYMCNAYECHYPQVAASSKKSSLQHLLQFRGDKYCPERLSSIAEQVRLPTFLPYPPFTKLVVLYTKLSMEGQQLNGEILATNSQNSTHCRAAQNSSSYWACLSFVANQYQEHDHKYRSGFPQWIPRNFLEASKKIIFSFSSNTNRSKIK